MKLYTVAVNFGFIGATGEYDVYAETREEAEEEALSLAAEELSIEYVEEEDEDE